MNELIQACDKCGLALKMVDYAYKYSILVLYEFSTVIVFSNATEMHVAKVASHLLNIHKGGATA